MSNIPRDIWLYIADFIPNSNLRDMISVNSAFFDIGMNVRYKEVDLDVLNKTTVKLLVHLMDPLIAKRIRVFKIGPYNSFLSKSDNLNRNGENVGNDAFMDRARDNAVSKKLKSDLGTQKYPCTLDGLVQALTDAVSCWTNVVEFAANECTVQQLQSFLPAAWSTFGPSLRKVSLTGSLASIQTFLSAVGPLPVLQELRLKFGCNFLRKDDQADNAILVDVVAPLIDRVSPTLEALSITSLVSTSLSDLFLKMGFLPFLRQFAVRFPFNSAFPVNADCFTRFLRDHSRNLNSVVLRLNPPGPMEEESLCQWMTQTSSDPCILANLRSFHIYPTYLDAGFNAVLAYLGRTAATLTDLNVSGRYLSFDQVSSIVNTFSPRTSISPLQKLCLQVPTLSLALFDLFAETLPGLHTLALFTKPHDESSLYDVRNGLRQRTYPNWKLYDILIFGSEMDGELMKLLAGSTPSLRSFYGQGNMSLLHIW